MTSKFSISFFLAPGTKLEVHRPWPRGQWQILLPWALAPSWRVFHLHHAVLVSGAAVIPCYSWGLQDKSMLSPTFLEVTSPKPESGLARRPELSGKAGPGLSPAAGASSAWL